MGKKQSAEQVLKAHLRDGEQIRWQGETEPFPLLEKDAKLLILGKWIGTLVVAAAFITLYLTHNAENGNVRAVLLVLVVAVWMVASPFLEQKNVLRQRYWITDQRAILMTKSQTFYAMELSEIDDAQVVNGKTAYGCLVLGSCLFEEINRQLRWRACHPKIEVQSEGETEQAVGMIFYNVKNIAEAAACLEQGCNIKV